MRVLLINPFVTSAERYGIDIGAIGGHQAPLGLCYLAAFLEKKGHEVKLIDAEAARLENIEILDKIRSFKPGVVGITSTTVAFNKARTLAAAIKSYDPAIPVIIGGPHVTANPLRTLSFECFDYGVIKEGEITLSELVKALEENGSIESIQGIVYRKDGNVVMTPPRPYIKELDEFPLPARHLLANSEKYLPPLGCYLYKPVMSMLTSRGCPYECIFCDNNVFGRNIRYHSPGRVISEMEEMISRYGAREIFFVDDTFTVDRARTEEILSLMRKKRMKIKWSCMTRAGNIDKEMVREMKESGCWQISMGVESGNQKVLDFIKKRIKLEDVINAAGWCKDAGIYVKGFFMLGHPIDTMETIDQTIDFAVSTSFSDAVVTISTPIPGTELYSLAPRYGTFRDEDWAGSSYWKPVFVPAGLTEEYLLRKQRQFYAKFYLRPGIILKQLRKIRSVSVLVRYGISILKVVAGIIFQRRGRAKRKIER